MVLLIRWLTIFWLLTLSFSGYGKSADVSFAQKNIKIKNTTLKVEVAETPTQHERGLMFREKLEPGRGMLFVFPNESYRSFWMKNTYIDLSIGYFDKNRKLIEVIEMKATAVMQTEFPSYPSSRPAQYALEVPKGWFKKNGIKQGDIFNWD